MVEHFNFYINKLLHFVKLIRFSTINVLEDANTLAYFAVRPMMKKKSYFIKLANYFFAKIQEWPTKPVEWRHDIQHNDTQHNDTQHNDSQHNDSQHNDSQHNDSQNNDSQHNDSQHNDSQHNDSQYNESQHNDTQHNDTQHNDTQHKNYIVLNVIKDKCLN
jgi:hypothetical protein